MPAQQPFLREQIQGVVYRSTRDSGVFGFNRDPDLLRRWMGPAGQYNLGHSQTMHRGPYIVLLQNQRSIQHASILYLDLDNVKQIYP